MKKLLSKFVILVMMTMTSALAIADAVYPYTNPHYIPTATSPALSYTAPTDYSFSSNNIGVATVRITGTCTSLAATVQGSNDLGTNWTDLNVASVSGGASTVALSTTGFWKVNSGGFNKLRVHITALTASCTVAMAGTGPGVIHADPCLNPSIMMASVAVNQASSVTSALVPAVAGKSTYVCGFAASAVGTNPTLTFKYGTQVSTACDTGAVNLTGPINPSATVGMINLSNARTVFASSASNQLCLTTAATTTVTGVLTYIQQ
jgi:hypothetical protein